MDYLEEAVDPVIKQAKYLYPILGQQDITYKRNPQKDRGFLEFWPGDEPGSPEYPRPREFPMGKSGVEIFDERTRPIDILGDVVSHQLIKTDPDIKGFYEKFEGSLTKKQKDTLHRQYEFAKENEGEKRPFEDWYERSGLPAYFRGYAFQQWDKPEEMYTKDQLKMFDKMMTHLGRR